MKTENKLILAIACSAILLLAATSGNIQWTQLRSDNRHGTGTQGQSFTGSSSTNDCGKFDANGNIVTAGTPCGPTTNQNIRTIGAGFGSFQSGATALAAAQTACVPTYFAGTIQAVEIIADQSGSATFDIRTVAHGSWTGTSSASSISGGTFTMSSAARYTDTTLMGWTTSLSAGTDVCFVMTSPTTVAGLNITVKVAAN